MDEPRVAWSIEDEHLALAARAVAEHAVRTRTVPCAPLGDGAFLKLENEQRTGSFKLRGALAALASIPEDRRSRGVLTASAGNHGYGLAEAGRRLGVPVTVFVGAHAPRIKREGIAAAGAEVEVADAVGYDAVELRAKAAALERGVPFVSPFDDPYVAAGNGGTIAAELLLDVPGLRAIIASVGGGGLVAGIAAARRHAGARFELIGVQSEACPAMVESLARGEAILEMEGAPTLAEGLEGGVSATTFAIARRELAAMEAVAEDAIADAMRFAHLELGLSIEGSAAVALAYARAHVGSLPRPFAVILSGGNVDDERLGALVGSR
ncbi:MAG: threonine/serine dehydratase [Sandaracinaceae bacterium]